MNRPGEWARGSARHHRAVLVMVLGLAGAAFAAGGGGRSIAGIDPDKVHRQAFVCDLHSDTLDRLLTKGGQLGVLTPDAQMDLPRLQQGGVDLQFFACWVPPALVSNGPGDPDSSAWRVDQMIDRLEAEVAANAGAIAIARTAGEAEAIVASGKIAAAMGIEGGHAIENSLEKVEHFYGRGIRYMTLTWNNTNDWADAAREETLTGTRHGGLTDFGRQVVRRMNELGMMVDISHVSESTFWDVMMETTEPVIASHSSVYAINPHFRNLTDDQIRAVAANGGVVCINFYSAFLDSHYNHAAERAEAKHRAELDSLREAYKGNPQAYDEKSGEILKAEMAGEAVPLDRLVDHIDYVVHLVGEDYVGLGSDFDGVDALPVGMEDVSKLPNLTRRLLERGYTPEQVRKILGGNFLRVFRAVCG